MNGNRSKCLALVSVFSPAVLWISSGVTPAAGQTRPATVQKTTRTVIRTPAKAQILEIKPASVPAGWSGDLVLTGAGFAAGMKLNIGCYGAELIPEDLTVESPTRAVARVRVPRDVQEHNCQVYLEHDRQPAAFRVTAGPKQEYRPPKVTAIEPDTAAAGWSGELVLTGENFYDEMYVMIVCRADVETGLSDIGAIVPKVDRPTRAVVRITVPENTKEGACDVEIDREQQPELFRISGVVKRRPEAIREEAQARKPAPEAKAEPAEVAATFVGEGDMQFMELVMKMQQAAMGAMRGEAALMKGRVLVTLAAVKFVHDGKTLFEEPPATVQAVEEIGMMGRPTGAFRIVFANGRIYNFMAEGRGASKNEAHLILKKALGK